MRTKFTSLVVGIALAVAWVLPAAGQSQFVKAPFTLENVVFRTAGPGPHPVALPASEPVNLAAPCGTFPYATATMNVVDNGIDFSISGSAFGCEVAGTFEFDVLLEVPVVSSDSVAFVMLVPEAGPATLSNSPIVPGKKGTGVIHLVADRFATTAELAFPLETDFPDVRFAWSSDPATLGPGSNWTRMIPLIPGDQVRIPVTVAVSLKSATVNGDRVEGSVSARFEFQTRLPLPVSGLSPSLSIPIGVMGLTGLARLRG